MEKLSVAFWGVIFLLIIFLAGCGGGGGGGTSTTASSNTTIDPNTSIPKIANLNASLDSGGGTAALNTAIASIKQGQNVSNAYIATDGTTIAIELSNGAKGYIFTDNKGQATNIPAQKTILNQLAMPTITTSNIINGSHSLSTVTPGNKTAVIYAPLEDEFKTNYAKVKADLQAVGYAVTTYYNTDATLSNLMQALSSNYGIIIIDSHGKATSSNEFYFLTGEDYNANTYKNLLNTYKSGVTSEKELAGWITFATRDPQSNWKFAVSNKLINDYKYNKSIVYVNACSSFENSSMNDAFVNNGASAYIGWTHTIDITMSNSAVVEYFDALTNSGATIKGAYNTVENDAVLKGMGSFHGIRFPSSDINISYLKYNQFSTDDIYLAPKYNVSGTATLNGIGLSGVLVSLSGASSSTTTTDTNGAYTFDNLPNGTYTVTVSKAGYTFAPSTISNVVVNGSNVTNQNFSGTLTTTPYSMSGTIHSGSNTGAPLSGAIVSIAGKTATTTSTGTFSIAGITGGTYPLSISKPGYNTFTSSVYSVNSNQTGKDFYLTPSTVPKYSMTGTIHIGSNSGQAIPNAIVSIAGKLAITDNLGAFTITEIPSGHYSFSVSKAGYDTYTNPAYYIGSIQTGLNFYLVISSASLYCPQIIGPTIDGIQFLDTTSYQLGTSTANTAETSTLSWEVYYQNINYLPTGSWSGSLRAQLWAVPYSFPGGTKITGYPLGTFTPSFTGPGSYSTNQVYVGAYSTSTISSTASSVTPPVGTYCIIAVVDEYNSLGGCTDPSGYCFEQWIQFPGQVTFR